MHQTAELRRWRREKDYFTGYVYNDPNDVWEDGEFTDFSLEDHSPSGITDNGMFYLVYIGSLTVFKLMKDDEIK